MRNNEGESFQFDPGEKKDPPKVGEWFQPITEYDKTPHLIRKKDMHAKGFHHEISGIGRVHVLAQWEPDYSPSRFQGEMNVLASPYLKGFFPPGRQAEIETQYESRLINIIVEAPADFAGIPFPYTLELRLSDDETIYQSPFETNFELDPVDIATSSPFYHLPENPDKTFNLYFPETSPTYTSLLMRLMPNQE
jgi:hypothetical protein